MTACTILLISAAAAVQVPDNVLLEFSATWCGPCRQVAPIVDKLHKQGLPIRKIDVDANPGLTQRFRIQGIPAFVLIVNGKVVERSVGYTSEKKLREMMARIPAQVANNRSQPLSSKQPSRERPAELKSQPERRFQLPIAGSESPKPPVVRANLDDEKSSDAATPLAASTRIRVIDGDGVNYGSGTVIDSRPGRTIVLTCAHIFRDISTKATIEVDLFDGEESRTYQGKKIDYDLEADVGLIAIATSDPVASVPLVPASDALRKGADVLGIGCGGGKEPVKLPMRVTSLNRYLGPDNIECTVVPQQGRSGGGLFDSQGRLVGVCFAADPKNARGLYAGIRPIRQLLQKAGVELTPPKTENAVIADTSTSDEQTERPRTVRVDQRQLALMQVNLPGRKRKTESTSGAEANPFPEATPPPKQRTVEVGNEVNEQIKAINRALEKTTGAEVICIVRPIDNPRASSEVVIINRASPKFVQYLRNEVSNQPRKTSRSVKWQDTLTPAQLQATLKQERRERNVEEPLVSPFRQVSTVSQTFTTVRKAVANEPGRYRRSRRAR